MKEDSDVKNKQKEEKGSGVKKVTEKFKNKFTNNKKEFFNNEKKKKKDFLKILKKKVFLLKIKKVIKLK